jgi:hypothetical protein
MQKFVIAACALLIAVSPGAAQDSAASRIETCQKVGSNLGAKSGTREGMYVSATCIAARAGLSTKGDEPLSQPELLSILLLMSTQPAPNGNAS